MTIDDSGFVQHQRVCPKCLAKVRCLRGIQLYARKERKAQAIKRDAYLAATRVIGYVEVE